MSPTLRRARHLIRLIAVATPLIAAGIGPAAADTVGDFYKGKTISLIVGVQEGTFYDLSARNAGQLMQKHLPGNPTVIAQNMPGASSGRATEYLYNVAPRDGTALLVAAPYIVLNQILTPSVKYKAEEFVWIGRIAPLTQVGFAWHTAGVETVEQAKQKEIILGAAGSGGPSTMAPWSLNRLVGTKFKVVRGYAGNAETFLALERGEIFGMGSVSVNSLTERGWVADKKVKILYTIATDRPADLPDTPTVVELVSNERDRTVMKLLTAMPDIGLTIFGTPAIPADRVAALREAFTKTVKTREFVQFLKTLDVDVDPLGGAEVEKLVRSVATAPPDIVDALKAAIAPMN